MGKEEVALWQYISMRERTTPGAPSTEAVRGRFKQIWQRIKGSSKTEKDAMPRGELHIPTSHLLDEVLPPLDWKDALSALDETLKDWVDAESTNSPIRVLVNPPYSGTSQVLNQWARRHEWTFVEMPSPEEVLRGGDEWLTVVTRGEPRPLVIPCLERLYLRHYNGLTLIRRFLDWLSSHPWPSLIGCNSWAWAYLEKAVQIGSLLPIPLTMAAFDAKRLRHWFSSMTAQQHGDSFRFFLADSGSPLFSSSGEDSESRNGRKAHPPKENTESENDESNGFLPRLAAHSRGIPGVAWATFRDGLRLAPETDEDEAKETSSDVEDKRTLWVKPWSKMTFTNIPNDINTSEVFLLHTLLLHGTVPRHMLAQLLPFSPVEMLHAVNRMRNKQLIIAGEEGLRIPALAYPAVRQFIDNEGYAVDDF